MVSTIQTLVGSSLNLKLVSYLMFAMPFAGAFQDEDTNGPNDPNFGVAHVEVSVTDDGELVPEFTQTYLFGKGHRKPKLDHLDFLGADGRKVPLLVNLEHAAPEGSGLVVHMRITPYSSTIEGIPKFPSRMDVDNVWKAIRHVRKKHFIDKKRVGIGGHSRYAELAALLATRHRQFKLLVLHGPTSMAFFQKDFDPDYVYPTSTWWSKGAEVPFVPYRLTEDNIERAIRYASGDVSASREIHDDSIANFPELVEAAKFPFHKVRGPIFIDAGLDDPYWPAVPMMDEVVVDLAMRRFRFDVEYDRHSNGHSFGPNTQEKLNAFMNRHFFNQSKD